MVSVLWKACSEGDLANVHEFLKEASVVDIEIKDHTGVTPLIEAVKNGHAEVVRALLEKGADPTNSSSQGRPQHYTSDPTILDLLNNALSKMSPDGAPPQQPVYPQDPNADPAKQYYGIPPQAPYGYYPPGPPMAEGTTGYYPPPPPPQSGEQQWPGGPGNLPPADVARYIPCRYFPACRYGTSCLFLHPQGPYYQGPMPPPAQYPAPYDPNVHQGYPQQNYYAMPPPPSFQPPNGVPQHMNPMSPPVGPHQTPPPPPPMTHARSGSEIVSPVQGHFSPNGVPPVPYNAMSPVSPSYPHAGQVPVPLSIPPLPPLQQQIPHQGPQSPQNMYHNQQHGGPTSAPPFVVRHDAAGQYPPQHSANGHINGHVNYAEANGGPKSPPLQSQNDAYGSGPMPYREGMGHARRGSIRRGSLGGRKPPCLFFPAGRCKNGDECRFPHVMPEGPLPHHSGQFPSRGGSRGRGGHNNNGSHHFKVIEEKFAAMALQEQNGQAQPNGVDGSSRSQSTDGSNRPRPHNGAKSNGLTNGHRVDKRFTAKQRVPNADEFPVLTGATTPPSRSPGSNGSLSNGFAGPTAAQVLQAPPPARRDSAKESSLSPEPESKPAVETNGHVVEASQAQDAPLKKMPISFAAVATAAPEVPKEVTVSA